MTIGKENYSVVYDEPFDQRFGRLGRNCILNTGLVQKIKMRCTKLHFDIPGKFVLDTGISEVPSRKWHQNLSWWKFLLMPSYYSVGWESH